MVILFVSSDILKMNDVPIKVIKAAFFSGEIVCTGIQPSIDNFTKLEAGGDAQNVWMFTYNRKS